MAAEPTCVTQRTFSSPESTFLTTLEQSRLRHDDWNNSEVTTLVLGTAQWGREYGVTNERGRLSDTDLSEIVEEAKAQRIDQVDTARSYGDAESRLRKFAQNFTITTKVAGSIDIVSQIHASMVDLGVSDIDTLLIHD